MTAPLAAVLIVGALLTIAAMYVWMIRSNRRLQVRMERRRQRQLAGLPESVMADYERNRR